MNPAQQLHALRGGALADQLVARGRAEGVNAGFDLGHRRVGQRHLDRRLAHHALVRQTHAVGRQHAAERVRKNARHAQRVGDPAGVLATGAAEALQRVARHVVATGD